MDTLKEILTKTAWNKCPHCKNLIPAAYAFPITYVKCETCGELHEMESKDYVTIYGDIHIGYDGGIIGHNFGFDGAPSVKNDRPLELARATVFCRDKCFQGVADRVVDS